MCAEEVEVVDHVFFVGWELSVREEFLEIGREDAVAVQDVED